MAQEVPRTGVEVEQGRASLLGIMTRNEGAQHIATHGAVHGRRSRYSYEIR